MYKSKNYSVTLEQRKEHVCGSFFFFFNYPPPLQGFYRNMSFGIFGSKGSEMLYQLVHPCMTSIAELNSYVDCFGFGN